MSKKTVNVKKAEKAINEKLAKKGLKVMDPKKPVLIKKVQAELNKEETKVEPKAVKKGDSKKVSKMDQATEYLESNLGLRRKDAITYFKDTVGLTPAGAATYWNIIRKKLNYQTAKAGKSK